MTATLPSGRKFYAAWVGERKHWHATILKSAARNYRSRSNAEGAAIEFAVALPVFLGKISVERLA